MDWFEWVLFALQIIVTAGGVHITFKADRHYKKGEYQQAIYNMLIAIFLLLCVLGGGII